MDRSVNLAPGAVHTPTSQFPVFYAASPRGGSAPVTGSFDPYPIANDSWTQKPGEINVVFGAATATLAYDGSGSGTCQVFVELRLNGQQVGGGEVSTGSTTPQKVEQSIGAQPQIDPISPITNQLSARTGSNGDCTPDSTIDSTPSPRCACLRGPRARASARPTGPLPSSGFQLNPDGASRTTLEPRVPS